MDEKKIIYKIILGCWELCKKYLFVTLDDEGWEKFIEEANTFSNEFKNQDEKIWELYRDIVGAIISYKEKRDKNA